MCSLYTANATIACFPHLMHVWISVALDPDLQKRDADLAGLGHAMPHQAEHKDAGLHTKAAVIQEGCIPVHVDAVAVEHRLLQTGSCIGSMAAGRLLTEALVVAQAAPCGVGQQERAPDDQRCRAQEPPVLPQPLLPCPAVAPHGRACLGAHTEHTASLKLLLRGTNLKTHGITAISTWTVGPVGLQARTNNEMMKQQEVVLDTTTVLLMHVKMCSRCNDYQEAVCRKQRLARIISQAKKRWTAAARQRSPQQPKGHPK